MRRSLLPAAALAALLVPAAADVVRLQTGETLEGTYVGGSRTSIHLEVEGRVQVLHRIDVRSITFGPIGATRPVEAPLPPVARPAAPRDPRTVIDTSPVTVPAGTPVRVRLRDTLDSNRQTAGYRFECVLQDDLAVGPRVIAPYGSRAIGLVSRASHAGTVMGGNSFTLTVTHVEIDHRLVPVRTSSASASNAVGRVQREAGRRPRGETVGEWIGAYDDDPRGDLPRLPSTGQNNRLYLSSGTVLAFRLEQPLALPGTGAPPPAAGTAR